METKIIYRKMSDIFKDIEFIGKNKKNQQQGYNFRGIDDMYNELHNLFAKHEVFIKTKVLKVTREDRVTKSGGGIIYTILEAKVTFCTTDGSKVSSILIGESMDSADKSANKAMSAALKYALMQTFLIPTEDLKDADTTTPEPSVKAQIKATNGDLKNSDKEDQLLISASDKLKEAVNVDDVKRIWDLMPSLRANKIFIKMIQEAKEKFTPKNELSL